MPMNPASVRPSSGDGADPKKVGGAIETGHIRRQTCDSKIEVVWLRSGEWVHQKHFTCVLAAGHLGPHLRIVHVGAVQRKIRVTIEWPPEARSIQVRGVGRARQFVPIVSGTDSDGRVGR